METHPLVKPLFWTLAFFSLLLSGTIQSSATAFTSERIISGTVTSQDGEELAGVNVVEKNTVNGTFTNVEGTYSINVKDNALTLVFSYIGYQTIEVDINGREVVDVILIEDATIIEEVIVVGYGTVKKSDLTGAVASVKEEELRAYPSQNVIQALQGRASGLHIQSNNGEPGSEFKVRVRGATSINAGSDPIYVVDGFVGAALPPAEDIASVEVLKDASATAIYGARGSNGVILINTKKGKPGKTVVNFNSSYSVQEVSRTLDLLEADDFVSYIREIDQGYTSSGANTDWQDEIFQTGGIQNYQLSLSGGTDAVNYYLSGNYYDQKGVIINSDYKRYSLTSNIGIQPWQRVKIGVNTFAQRTQRDGTRTQESGGGESNTGVVAAAFHFEPDQGIYEPDGSFTISKINDPHDNPVAIATQRENELIGDLLQTNVFASLDIAKGLAFTTTLGGSYNNIREGEFIPTTLNSGRDVGGEASIAGRKATLLLNENYLQYSLTFSEVHNLSVMAGYSYQKFNDETWSATGQSFISNAVNIWDLDGASSYQRPNSRRRESTLISTYSRLNYAFGGRYLFTLNARYDGSSAFSKNNKWAFFPSGAFAWNIMKEPFMENIGLMDQFKLRVSYGQTGNEAIAPYQTLATFAPVLTVVNGSPVNAFVPSTVANNGLTWETTTQLNVGADVGLFENRINLTIDYYTMKTTDLLFEAPVLEYTGYDPQLENVGEVENKGLELAISSRNLTGAFKWTTDLNFSRNRNKVLKLLDGNDILYDSAPGHMVGLEDTQVLREGEPVGAFYGWVYDGVYQEGDNFIPASDDYEQEAGGEKFLDIDESGELDEDDRTIIGDPNPDFIWALNNNFQFKGFDLNIFFQGSQGNDILSYTLMELDMMSGLNNATTDALNRWTSSNTNTDVPKATQRTRRVSSRWVFDGSYVRLKNIALGYSFPSSMLSGKNIQNLRIYISAQNVWTNTDYKGYDPEVNYESAGTTDSNRNLGLDYGSYPTAKSYTVGLNLEF